MPPRSLSIPVLARWLGPWTPATARPRRVDRVEVDAGGVRAWLYRPRGRVRGAYAIAPGLHYAGPADPRADRFNAILAASGALVLAPFVPDYCALRVAPSAIDDFARAFDALLARPELPRGVRPGVFSISFGSLLALRLAGDPARAERVGGVVCFGGYADWDATIRFCLGGERRDPLNQPVVLMNVLDDVPPAVAAQWRRYVEATWGRPEMKARDRHEPIARELAGALAGRERELFLIGCGVEPGAAELCERALATRRGAFAFVDPRPHLHSVRGAVHIVHGADDDVIPADQAHALTAALPRARAYVTGLYGHTAGSPVTSLPALGRELATMLAVLRAIATSGS